MITKVRAVVASGRGKGSDQRADDRKGMVHFQPLDIFCP
jgi:hypothetical protein